MSIKSDKTSVERLEAINHAIAQGLITPTMAKSMLGQKPVEKPKPKPMPEHEMIIRAHMHKYNISNKNYDKIIGMLYTYVGKKHLDDYYRNNSAIEYVKEFCTEQLCDLNFDADVNDILDGKKDA